MWDYCRVRASCPPDTRIHVSAQRYVAPPSWGGGYTYYLDGDTIDFAGGTGDYYPIDAYEFTNPYYYIAMFVVFDDEDNYNFYGAACANVNGGGFVECKTAPEAEESIDDFACDGMTQLGFPICRLVLKNNGTISRTGQFMPIDPINRGRSYIWGEVKKQYTI